MRLLPAGVVLLATLAFGCSDSERARAEAGVRPTYDKTTGKLTELTLDANHNGHVDTWTDMDGARPLQTRIDRNEDGKVDRWEYYDSQAGVDQSRVFAEGRREGGCVGVCGRGRQDCKDRDLVEG